MINGISGTNPTGNAAQEQQDQKDMDKIGKNFMSNAMTSSFNSTMSLTQKGIDNIQGQTTQATQNAQQGAADTVAQMQPNAEDHSPGQQDASETGRKTRNAIGSGV